jgi:hypothetical protein
MSFEFPLRKEIVEYEEKIIAGLTLRNIIWSAAAVAISVAAALAASAVGIPASAWSWICMVVGIPLFIMGWWRPRSGIAPEKHAIFYLVHLFAYNTWVYRSESPWLDAVEYGGEVATDGRTHRLRRRARPLSEVAARARKEN